MKGIKKKKKEKKGIADICVLMRVIHWKVDVRDRRDIDLRSMDSSSITMGEKIEYMDTVASKRCVCCLIVSVFLDK